MQLATQITSSPFVFFALAGIVSGFLSGLLSIGGGFILVPALISIFATFYNFESSYAIQLVLGTTMSCMIFTAISSTLSQNKKESIYWEYILNNWMYIVLGTIVGVVLTGYSSTILIKLLFASFCIYSGLKMIFKKSVRQPVVNEFKKAGIFSFIFGILCGMISVGGANLVVPFLLKNGVEARIALGTASAFQVPVSVIGTATYLTIGLLNVTYANGASGAVGYIFIPGLIVITVFAIGFNKLGVSVAHKLPIEKLKKLFGGVTLLIGGKMLLLN